MSKRTVSVSVGTVTFSDVDAMQPGVITRSGNSRIIRIPPDWDGHRVTILRHHEDHHANPLGTTHP